MPTRSRLALLLASVLVLGVAAPAAASGAIDTARRTADAAAFEGRLIVVWKGEAPTTLRMAGVASTSPMERPMRSVVTTKPGRSAAVARALRADPRVLAVVPDAKLSFLDWPADGNPSDTRYGEQGDLAQIGVPEAWTTTRGDPSVVVAVIDSGVDLTHPDLDGVAVVDPRNMVWNNDDVTDQVGHGTHVMGTIVAETNNGEGIAGIAPDSTLMPIKIADDSGFVTFSDVLDGVDWARTHGADVINMSLGGALTVDQVALGQPTFTAARDAGILMVAAAGNEATQIRMYPASFAGVVSVSAVELDGHDRRVLEHRPRGRHRGARRRPPVHDPGRRVRPRVGHQHVVAPRRRRRRADPGRPPGPRRSTRSRRCCARARSTSAHPAMTSSTATDASTRRPPWTSQSRIPSRTSTRRRRSRR